MHLRPERLLRHAATAAALAEAVDGLCALAGGADAVAGPLLRARRELSELQAALVAAARGAEAADREAARAVDRAGTPW
jgi:hypothetical protein